ncbi:hypothetical protein GCM10020219_035500 [Nonomuraea dietziae]
MPIAMLRRAGVRAVSLDASMLSRRDEEPIGEAIEAGVNFFLGVLPGLDSSLPDVKVIAKTATDLWQRLGFAAEELQNRVVLTPTCGLAGASPAYAKAALGRLRETAKALRGD